MPLRPDAKSQLAMIACWCCIVAPCCLGQMDEPVDGFVSVYGGYKVALAVLILSWGVSLAVLIGGHFRTKKRRSTSCIIAWRSWSALKARLQEVNGAFRVETFHEHLVLV